MWDEMDYLGEFESNGDVLEEVQVNALFSEVTSELLTHGEMCYRAPLEEEALEEGGIWMYMMFAGGRVYRTIVTSKPDDVGIILKRWNEEHYNAEV